VDWEKALERHLGDEPFLHQALGMFRSSAEALIRKIEVALASGETAQARLAAHGLKGSASMLSVNGLHRLAGELETAARDGDLAEAGAVFGALKEEAGRVFEFLDSLGSTGPTVRPGEEERAGRVAKPVTSGADPP
jgi:HPt (histidine-containing phosphotransfer) domain-containing protein